MQRRMVDAYVHVRDVRTRREHHCVVSFSANKLNGRCQSLYLILIDKISER